MKCPHCRESFHAKYIQHSYGKDKDAEWAMLKCVCPACERFIFHLANLETVIEDEIPKPRIKPGSEILVWPRSSSRPPCPPEVPNEIAQDYKEACLVLVDSPKASAALSRRCLQNILREVAKVEPSDLSSEIEELLGRELPSSIAEAIDSIRQIGNFAAHPIKSQKTGEILDVEPGEAEWTLEVLEELFDFYFVKPAKMKKKRDELNNKLSDAGKPPMK